MLESFQTADLKPGNSIFIFDFFVSRIDEFSLVLFQKTETSNNNYVDYCKRTKLFGLIQYPSKAKRNKNEEGVSSFYHNYGIVGRVKQN